MGLEWFCKKSLRICAHWDLGDKEFNITYYYAESLLSLYGANQNRWTLPREYLTTLLAHRK